MGQTLAQATTSVTVDGNAALIWVTAFAGLYGAIAWALYARTQARRGRHLVATFDLMLATICGYIGVLFWLLWFGALQQPQFGPVFIRPILAVWIVAGLAQATARERHDVDNQPEGASTSAELRRMLERRHDDAV